MVMEVQPSQVQCMTEDEVNNIFDMDRKVKSAEGNEPGEPIQFGIVSNKNVLDGSKERVLDPDEVNEGPKNAVDEWPEPRQIHTFYFVKYRSYDDPKVKAKIDQADKEIQKKRHTRSQIIDALKTKRSERADVISQLKPLTTEDKSYRVIMDEKKKEMAPFQAALFQLRTVESARKSEGLCSSEEELDEVLRSLHFWLQHESNTVAEEKQMLKEIKYLERTREKVIANAAMTAKIGDSYGQKDEMRGQVKQLGVNLDAVRKDQQTVRQKIKKLEEKLNLINGDINSLEDELAAVDERINMAYETIRELRKAHNETNVCFQQNRALLNNARELAAKKNIAVLEDLHHAEVEKFLSQWNNKKAFRDDYERRILTSLDARQLSRDGRMRNPDEKPIILEIATPIEVEPPKAISKKPKDGSTQATQYDTFSSKNAHQEDARKTNEIEKRGKTPPLEDLPDKFTEESAKPNDIVAAQLKEMRRVEEIAKAKQALERKKKLAEKAAAKEAAKAQKNAEKKRKEKEKKARKKAAPTAERDYVEQAGELQTEEPKAPEVVKEAPLPVKINEPNVRYRGWQKGSNQPTKTILSRKKAPSYWIWAAPAAAVLLVIVTLGFYYTSSIKK